MKKVKKYEGGGDVSDYENPYKKSAVKKPLPSEIKTEDKAPFDKYVKEPFRRVNDKASKFFESKGLTNPVDVIDEELGGETIAEARARRAGMPTSKGVSKKAGGSVGYKSGGSVKARGCGIARKGLTKGKMV
jgi:hypothetical protein